MSRIDRLSSLLAHFHMSVSLVQEGQGNLVIYGDGDRQAPRRIEFCAEQSQADRHDNEAVLLSLFADWGGQSNPLINAVSGRISLPVRDDDVMSALIRVVLEEASAKRCGVDSVLSRLGEVIFVRLIRAEIERGAAETGLFAGLANPRISRAIVAMHENPGRSWRNDELAEVAGLSLSRFVDVFKDCLGLTPQSYLRQWRMTLAYQDIERGDRIKSVAHRYGYASSEALARAFQRQFGKAPLMARQRKPMQAPINVTQKDALEDARSGR